MQVCMTSIALPLPTIRKTYDNPNSDINSFDGAKRTLFNTDD